MFKTSARTNSSFEFRAWNLFRASCFVLRISALLLILCLAASPGCSNEEKLYRVSGAVTHGGKPIPKGLIFFDPTADGPQGFANILDGKYDTAQQGKGVRGGAYSIRVNGFDGKEANEAPFGQPLFPEYTGTKDLPQADSTYDLDVPKKQ
jgi:hypothetical protein